MAMIIVLVNFDAITTYASEENNGTEEAYI